MDGPRTITFLLPPSKVTMLATLTITVAPSSAASLILTPSTVALSTSHLSDTVTVTEVDGYGNSAIPTLQGVSSDNSAVAIATANGNILTITAHGPGHAAITVTAA